MLAAGRRPPLRCLRTMALCPCPSFARLRLALATFVAATLPLCALAETFYGADVRFAYDDNLPLAAAPADRLGDSFLTAGGHAGRFVVLANDDTVSVQAGAHAAAFLRYPLLDAVSIEAAASYRRKFGVGLTVPWIALRVDVSRDDYRDDIRDSDRAEIAIVAGARMSESFDVSAGVIHDRRLAHHAAPVVPGISGAIYDGAGDSVFIRAGYAATPRLLFDAALGIRRGDVVATTPEGMAIFVASTAIAEDPAFGPDRYGYRVRGTTTSASIALSYAIDDRQAVNVAYAFASTSAAAGLDYRNNVLSASWVWRY